MKQMSVAALFILLSMTTPLIADEKPLGEAIELQPVESVKWTPTRKIRAEIKKEIDKFDKSMKARLNPETLAFTPYIKIDDNPAGAGIESITVEQILNNMIKSLNERASGRDEDFMPNFRAFRRKQSSGGCDLVGEPHFSKHIPIGQLSGNTTLILDWELVEGKFKNKWDNNEVDEVYEATLNATLTLGIAISTRNDKKLMVIDQAITKPLVTNWRIQLVASEATVIPPFPAKQLKGGGGNGPNVPPEN